VTDAVLAIDLGTSAAKFLLVDGSGTVIARQRKRHRTFTPEDGSAEQDPH
jgi:sugar (pentulose or hexulose) kinase